MKFIQGSAQDAVQAIAERLHMELQKGGRVLWLTSGGSNIALEVQIMQQLHQTDSDQLDRLAIVPMDERYGVSGHKDSNTQQMREAGFDPGSAVWVDVLGHNLSLTRTVAFYSEAVATALASADVVVGQFGMGGDGHVAGIKPDSPSSQDDPAMVIGYEWSDYDRMTMSAEALKHITVGYVPAFGADKREALERLQSRAEPFAKLPAVVLYDLPEAYVFTDIELK